MLLFLPPVHLPIASAYLGGFDYDVTHFIRGLNNGGFLNTLFWWVTFTGSITFLVLITIALYIAGLRKEALVFAIIFILTTAFATAVKYAVARPRPSDLGVPPEAEPSFPSAHTANAFAFATTLSSYHRKFTVVLFAWAILVGFSRLYLGLHYFTDIIGGAILGIVVSLVVTHAAGRVDGELTRIVHESPMPTTRRGVFKVPLVVARQFFQVAYALLTELIREAVGAVDRVFAGKT